LRKKEYKNRFMKNKNIKWVGISGGWRKINQEVEKKARETVREIILRGDGIVSGGALGVDFVALDEALKQNSTAERIKIFLPTSFEIYAAHYRKRAKEGVITGKQAESLISQLTILKNINSSALIEGSAEIVNTETYYQRNSLVVEAIDELIAFHIISESSQGLGVNDTIQKAKQKGIPVKVFSYDFRQHKCKIVSRDPFS